MKEDVAFTNALESLDTLAPCPNEDVLVQFLSGMLASAARQNLELHFDRCHGCVELLGTAARALCTETNDPVCVDSSPVPLEAQGGGLGDYELVRSLGRGGGGIVYEARCRASGDRVAVKTISGRSSAAAKFVRREIRALHRINHPGVVRILAEGTSGGMPFYVMNLIEGDTLAERFAGDRFPVRDEEMLTILRRIASTLAFIHGQGIVHGDLTPRNIVLRGRDWPVLVDFGLTAQFPAALGRDVIEIGGRILGTPAYMAPEQIRGELVDARADLYALGCILYEWLTGRPPFSASSPDRLLRHHLETLPAPPMLRPGIPAKLGELTLRLLAKAPGDRVGYASEVSTALGELGATDWEDAPSYAPHGYVYRPRFVGRGDCLATLDDLVRRCIAGQGNRLFIGGDSGSGKTRLLAEAATRARRLRLRIAVAEELSNPMSGSGVITASPLYALRPLLREIYEECLLDPARPEQLRRACSAVLSECEGAAEEQTHADIDRIPLAGDAARARLFLRLRQILQRLADDGPLLLVIDDLQWADDLTLEFLRSVPASFFEQLPVLLICTYRREEITPPLRKLLECSSSHSLTLGRLDEDSVVAMACDMLGMRSMPAKFTELLARQSGGNPFLVGEYLRTAVELRWLHRTEQGSWLVAETFPLHGDGMLDVPGSVRRLVGQRLAILSPNARALTELAAVLASTAHGKGLDVFATGVSGVRAWHESAFLRQIGATGHLELTIDATHVGADGALAHVQNRRHIDRLIPAEQKSHDLALAGG